jgi:succinate dehydrogenase / fumarate reductase cytochrome b subunit
MNTTNRPLSPHLQIYKPQLTSVLSISHRMTGFALSMIVLLSPIIIYFLTYSAETHQIMIKILGNTFIKIIFSLALFGLLYHLCNGIRHLAWDAGYGLDLESSYKSGYIVLASSVALTFLILLFSGVF